MGIEWIFDGGMGTMLPDFEKDESDIRLSCNEYRNLIRPDDVKAVHRAFLSAGSTVVETNTFGANPIVFRGRGWLHRSAPGLSCRRLEGFLLTNAPTLTAAS